MKSLASSSRPSACSTQCCWHSRSSSCGRNSAMPRIESRKKPVLRRRSSACRAASTAETGVELRERLSAYINDAIVEDWPAMEHGRTSPTTTHALNAIYTLVLTVNPSDRRGAVILSEILDQLNFVTQARRARLVVATGIVPGIVWFVLFGGAVLTVGFTFFFATESLRAQTTDDRGADGADLLRTAHHRRHRPPVRGHCEGDAGGSLRGAQRSRFSILAVRKSPPAAARRRGIRQPSSRSLSCTR